MAGVYVIPLTGLKEGRHTYNFEIEESFFGLFEGSEITGGDLTATLELDKCSSHFDLRIKISGHVEVPCDRCLELYSQPVQCENRLLIRTGARWEENDPDMITIPVDENELDIKQYLYEFICLSLPLQKVHPADANGKSTCNPEMLAKLKAHQAKSETDPRWDELKKLMNNN